MAESFTKLSKEEIIQASTVKPGMDLDEIQSSLAFKSPLTFYSARFLNQGLRPPFMIVHALLNKIFKIKASESFYSFMIFGMLLLATSVFFILLEWGLKLRLNFIITFCLACGVISHSILSQDSLAQSLVEPYFLILIYLFDFYFRFANTDILKFSENYTLLLFLTFMFTCYTELLPFFVCSYICLNLLMIIKNKKEFKTLIRQSTLFLVYFLFAILLTGEFITPIKWFFHNYLSISDGSYNWPSAVVNLMKDSYKNLILMLSNFGTKELYAPFLEWLLIIFGVSSFILFGCTFIDKIKKNENFRKFYIECFFVICVVLAMLFYLTKNEFRFSNKRSKNVSL
jgi:hypothetical protein